MLLTAEPSLSSPLLSLSPMASNQLLGDASKTSVEVGAEEQELKAILSYTSFRSHEALPQKTRAPTQHSPGFPTA